MIDIQNKLSRHNLHNRRKNADFAKKNYVYIFKEISDGNEWAIKKAKLDTSGCSISDLNFLKPTVFSFETDYYESVCMAAFQLNLFYC